LFAYFIGGYEVNELVLAFAATATTTGSGRLVMGMIFFPYKFPDMLSHKPFINESCTFELW
jgi:hypothetical protein